MLCVWNTAQLLSYFIFLKKCLCSCIFKIRVIYTHGVGVARKTNGKGLPSTDSFPKFPQQWRVGDSRAWISHMGDRFPSNWNVICCLPEFIDMKLSEVGYVGLQPAFSYGFWMPWMVPQSTVPQWQQVLFPSIFFPSLRKNILLIHA